MQEVNISKLRGYRTMIGITQQEMAEKIGISERAYATKEADIMKFTVRELKEVLNVFQEHNLDIKPSDLF